MTRLKGIETLLLKYSFYSFLYILIFEFTNHDPIEGDWDFFVGKLLKVNSFLMFTNHDPIEGDWDNSPYISSLSFKYTLFTNHDPIEGDWDQALLGLGFRD